MMEKRIKLMVLVLLVVCPRPSFSQPHNLVHVKARLDRDTILVGDQIYYSLTVNGKKGVKFLFPEVSDSLGNGVDLIGKPTIDSVVTGNDVTFTLRYLVTAFDSGVHVIPSLPVVVLHGSLADTLLASAGLFFVKPIPRDSNQKDIFDIKPPIEEPITFSEVAPWAGSVLVLAALIVLLILYLRNRRQNKPFLNLFKPTDPPHVVALRELQRIRDNKLWNTENHKHYYSNLVDILRIYLEGRFDINAPEQTTTEILSEISKVDYNFGSLADDLQEFLFSADLVKFAKHIPLVTENEHYLNFAFDFVHKTKPEEVKADRATTDDTAQNPEQEIVEEPKKLN